MASKDIEKIHTTPMVLKRLQRNLGISNDSVEYCKQRVGNARVERKGKNWYVTTDIKVITINAYSHTIITAHKRSHNK